MHLLDVNVLIALCDSTHVHFPVALGWFEENASNGWATCPLTENGLLRILGNSRYPGNGAGSPEAAATALRGMIAAVPGHQFLADDISLLTALASLDGVTSAQLTDVYLVALAVNHGIQLLTLDQSIEPALVAGGASAVEILV